MTWFLDDRHPIDDPAFGSSDPALMTFYGRTA